MLSRQIQKLSGSFENLTLRKICILFRQMEKYFLCLIFNAMMYKNYHYTYMLYH